MAEEELSDRRKRYTRTAKERIAAGHESREFPTIQETRPEAPAGLGQSQQELRQRAAASGISPSGMAFVDDTLAILSRMESLTSKVNDRRREGKRKGTSSRGDAGTGANEAR